MDNIQPLPDLTLDLTVDRSGLTPTPNLSPGMSSLTDGRTIEAMVSQPPGVFYRQPARGPVVGTTVRYVPLPNIGYLEWEEEVQ